MTKLISYAVLSALLATASAHAQNNLTPTTFAKESAQTKDNHRSSKLVGQSVYNGSNDKIGSISDLIISPSGQISYAVIGVGGFLGVGEKDVAVDYKSLNISRNENGELLVRLDTNKEALKAAPSFAYYKEK